MTKCVYPLISWARFDLGLAELIGEASVWTLVKKEED